MHIDPELVYEPRRIVSIVGPSRSGSSAIKYAVSLHPELTSLAGEEEPYYKLAHNGYPWHDSDSFSIPNLGSLIKSCIANELYGYNVVDNRRWLQKNMIEEPPFVEPIPDLARRLTDTLLLKTPQNVYRRHVLEYLYPNAHVTYIVTRRDRYATINGLMDGWEGNNFKARSLPMKFSTIDGFEDVAKYRERRWWKFDMPPGWDQFVVATYPLYEICAYQADNAAWFATKMYSGAITVEYEQFLEDWRGVTYDVWDQLGLDKFDLSGHNLPELMATDPPKKDRWKEKRPWLKDVC